MKPTDPIIKLTITPEDAGKAGNYSSLNSCLLCQAWKREFPGTEPAAGGVSLTCDVACGGVVYLIDNDDADAILHAYMTDDGLYGDRPTVTEPFTVTLTLHHINPANPQ